MATFNLILDDDVVKAVDGYIEHQIPKQSRRAYIEGLLYREHKAHVDQLKAERREREARQATEAPDAQLAGAAG